MNTNRAMRGQRPNRRQRRQNQTQRVITETVMVQPQRQVAAPGQGKSRSARRRRNRRQGMAGTPGSAGFPISGRISGAPNEYLMALMDPENHPGCRVPDLVTIPSSTFQLSYDATISPGVGGDGVLVVITPENYAGGTLNARPLQLWNNTAAGGNYAAVTQGGWTQASTISTLFDTIRPVSGVLYAEYVGKSTDDSGQITMGWLPRGTVTPVTQVGANFNAILTQAFTKTIPLRNGAVVTWKPQDNQDLEYFPSTQGQQAGGTEFPPAIYFATAGQQQTASVRMRAVFNFEAIPTTDTALLLSPQVSRSNLSALQEAMNWASGAYNNLSAFVGTVSPYVQPVLGRIVTSAAQAALQGAMSNRGDTLRIRY